MIALTLHQPWASLWVHGIKVGETRDWSPWYGLPLDLVVHAGKARTDEAKDLFVHLGDPWSDEMWANIKPFLERYPTFEHLPFGAVVGTVTVEEDIPTEDLFLRPGLQSSELPYEEPEFGDLSPGRRWWRARDHRAFSEPIPARGHRKLWRVPRELESRLRRAA